jgi:hypothetical protein
MKLACAGLPLTNRPPVKLPKDLRIARISMSVDLPAPLGPMSAYMDMNMDMTDDQ